MLIVILTCAGSLWALAKTMGTPIGGMGTGYVKFDATTGDFATSGKVPPAASEQHNEFGDKKSISSGFHFFAGGQPTKKATTANEDAKCPLYTADFGKTGDVSFTLNAFGPFIPGDQELYYKLATSPLAYFEITAKNESAAAIEVAVAMEFTNKSGKNLLGGADNAEVDAASNNKAISFPAVAPSTDNAYLMVDCDNAEATYSAGALGTFLTNGSLANTAGNLVAAKCTIPGGQTARFKFTLAWWRLFVSTVDRYGSGKVDEDNYYYHNFYANSKDAATFGMTHFDMVRNAVVSMVNRVMGSNFPEWYKERLLNNTYPLINNAVCTKDGRVAFWEGLYPILGTIDQAQHAAIWYAHNWPKGQWQELQYWLRTAHRGVGEDPKLKGQIHHDFNRSPNQWTDDAHHMCPWDNYLRPDYWFQPNTTDWSDLNTMAIFKTYELMLATGNLDSMKLYFPKLLLTADRLVLMGTDIGKHLPFESKSTYDSQGLLTPQYSSGVALTAYLAMVEMAKFVGDAASEQKFRDLYTIARKEYKSQMFNSAFCTGRVYAEGDIAGVSWGNYFCLEPVMDYDVINEGCKRLWQFFGVQSLLQKKLGQWHFYTCDHWGGAEIARGCPDTAMTMFKWDYDYYHQQSPAYVFWQDLWENHDQHASYMTAPCAWRSFFQMTGYLLDNANNRLWIRPQVPSSMNKKITNAPLVNSKGWGTLVTYDENIDETTTPPRMQSITIKFDSSVTVKEIILKNNTSTSDPTVKIGGVAYTPTLEYRQFEGNLRVALPAGLKIDSAGVVIEVFKGATGTIAQRAAVQKTPLAIKSPAISAGKLIHYSVDKAGDASMELLTINGAKIGTIMQQKAVPSGEHSFVWNGRTADGKKVSSMMMILRLSTSSGNVAKLIFAEIK